MSTTATTPATLTRVYEHARSGLTNVDRCDRCGAQAYFRVAFDSRLVLLLCAHHATRHFNAIVLSDPLVIDDYRPFLAEQERQPR